MARHSGSHILEKLFHSTRVLRREWEKRRWQRRRSTPRRGGMHREFRADRSSSNIIAQWWSYRQQHCVAALVLFCRNVATSVTRSHAGLHDGRRETVRVSKWRNVGTSSGDFVKERTTNQFCWVLTLFVHTVQLDQRREQSSRQISTWSSNGQWTLLIDATIIGLSTGRCFQTQSMTRH